MKNKDLLIDEFGKELATFIKLRIDCYHQTQQSKINFINNLICCPIQRQLDKSDLTAPSWTIDKLICHLHIDSIDVEHVDVTLNQNFNLNYLVWLDITSFGEEFFGEQIFVNYCEGKCEIADEDDFLQLMSQLSEESLRDHIKAVQREITFGTVMN